MKAAIAYEVFYFFECIYFWRLLNFECLILYVYIISNVLYYFILYIFSPITTDETFKINKGPLNCNSKKVVYLSECKKCKNPYVGKAQTKFRMRLNNYKSAHKSFKTKKRETQKLFHGHYIQDDHEGKDDWQFTLIDQCTTNAELRKRELYWQHRLKTFFQNGLNEREESCL